MCDLCGVDFETQQELTTHMANDHPPDDIEEDEVKNSNANIIKGPDHFYDNF
jgi:hypothetical protein